MLTNNHASRFLVDTALALGHAVSVDDGGDWAVKRSSDLGAIMAAIESVDESFLVIRDAQGKKLGWAVIILGNDPDEEIADCSANPYMDAHCMAYDLAFGKVL